MRDRFEALWAAADGWERQALVMLLVGAVAQTTFVLIYASRRPWRWPVGRALLFKSAALAVLLDLSVANTFVPPYRYQEQVSALTIDVIVLTIVYQLWVLVRSPRSSTGT